MTPYGVMSSHKPIIITPQVTRKIVHAMNECNVMNELIGQGKRLITEITTPDFF